MNKAPAFQFYAGDWLKSRAVRLMTDYQRGWYIQLLAEAWDGSPQCMLPDDDGLLQVLAGVSDLTKAQPDFNARWTAVKRLFKQDGNYVYNERQMDELAGQKVRREKAVLAGQASAKARERKRKELQDARKAILTESNDCSTGVESELNSSPTLLSSSSDCNLLPSNSIKKPRGDFDYSMGEFKRLEESEAVDLITRYAASKGHRGFEAQRFYDFHASKGFVIGKAPMKSWKHAIGNAVSWCCETKHGKNGAGPAMPSVEIPLK